MDLQPIREKWYRTTYNKDMAVILEIMKHYQDLSDDEQLRLIDKAKEDEDGAHFEVKMPDWVIECREFLKQEHGDDYMTYFVLIMQELGIVEKFNQVNSTLEETLS